MAGLARYHSNAVDLDSPGTARRMTCIDAAAMLCEGDPMSRPGRPLVVVACALVALVGCQEPDGPGAATPGASTPDATTAAATSAADCNHPPDTGGGDGGLGAGFDYTDEHHDFGDSATVTLCMTVPGGAVRAAGSAAHVVVTPQSLPGPGSRFTFTVTVSPGPPGGIDLEVVDDDGDPGITFHGPAVQTDDSGWYLGAARG